jgi:VanZ like protein
MAMLVYGSLLPGGFDLSGFTAEAGGTWPAVLAWITSPRWVPAVAEVSSLGVPNWVSDLVLNLLLYGPLGVLLRLTASRVSGRHIVQVLSAVSTVVLLSWVIESTQSLIPGRYASIQDVLANSLGGAVGVLLGHRVNSLWRAVAFTMYRWTSGPAGGIYQRLLANRRRPVVMFMALMLNAVAIGLWCLLTARSTDGEQAVSLVPFEWQFGRSYDVAAVLLGRSMIVYCLAGAVLMLTMMRGRTRAALGWIVLTVSLMAAGMEAAKLLGGALQADVTEPLLALIAGGLVLVLGFMLVHACRCSCRRRDPLPVEVDRRGRQHDYRFALGTDNQHKTGR